MDLLSGLNAPQREAVMHGQGPLLIFAGAGSGKTRTLTHRIAYLIQEHRVRPGQILAVTFTNKASKEMRERLEKLIGSAAAKRMWLGTFHALCARMLRIHGDRIGLNPRFSIFDADDQIKLVKEVVKEANLDTERFPPARVLGRIYDAKNELKSPAMVAAEATKPHEKVYAQLYARYQERLRAASALDFDDLLGEAVRLLKESPESLEHWRERFQHVLIDEFQDVNEAQFQWARLIASKHRNICVVGDDDQCLVPGTLITTQIGRQKIEDLRAGDTVLGAAGRDTTALARISEAKSKPFRGSLVVITTRRGHEVKLTPNHLCFARSSFGARARRTAGAVVVTMFGNVRPARGASWRSHQVQWVKENARSRKVGPDAVVLEREEARSIDRCQERARQVAAQHGGAQIEQFAALTYGDLFRLMPASDLRESMMVAVLEDGRLREDEIVALEREKYDGPVYDLDIENLRNYAANGIVVHNSIYAWRGANVQIILDFEKVFANATVVRLEQNYRSTQNILDAAYGVISKNLSRAPKRLWTEENGGEKITLHGALNAQEEAAWIVRQIELARREHNLDWKDFAVLCRVNAQSRPFEEAFIRARAPLKLVGTQRFYERREIRDVLAYLKWIYNPDDGAAAARLINTPPRGIGAATIGKLVQLANDQNRSLGAILLDSETDKSLAPAVARKIEPLRRLLVRLLSDAREHSTLADLVERVLERTQMRQWLENDRDADSVDRVANVEELVRAAEGFDLQLAQDVDESGETSEIWNEDDPLRLGLFLSEIALNGAGDKDNQSGQTDDAVTFMTLHAAKGLEFPVVFLAGAEQGLLPHARAIYNENASDAELEEERRLMYVGLTRARQRVILTFAAQRTMHGRTETTIPSQFLDEIPANLIKREGLAAGGSRLVMQSTNGWGRDNFNALPRPNFDSKSAFASNARREENEVAAQFKVGDKVDHKSYGDGLVVAASNQGGAGEWVEVAFFGGAGKKKLIVAYANLSKVAV